MSFFKEIEGEAAVIVENGIFKQVALAERDGYLYAKAGGGFIRLHRDGSTSKSGGKTRWDYISCNSFPDDLGRLKVQP